MAKRKRLSAPNPSYIEQTERSTAKGPFSAPTLPPIAGVAADASATAALEELSRSVASQRAAGHMILQLDLDTLDLDHLVRDRITMDEAEMQALMNSLKARGQQTPIEVMEVGDGRYGLISGWRRSQALRRLAYETGEERFCSVLALLRRPQDAPDAYQAMVEENEIRVGLSHFERARIVLKSVEQGVFDTEKKALQTLFASASRSKRSKIGSFVTVVRHLDGTLRFPTALGERLGLSLAKAIEADGDFSQVLRESLLRDPAADADAEQAALERAAFAKKKPLKSNLETNDKDIRDLEKVFENGRLVLPGLRVLLHPNGDLTLAGPGLTPEIRASFHGWLKTLE